MVEILERLQPGELIVVKNLLDGGGGYLSLRKLVFKDLSSEVLRQRALEQFQRAGPGDEATLRKVLSSIDDTLYSSGGKFPHGLDNRLPACSVYPGILRLFAELDVQTADKRHNANAQGRPPTRGHQRSASGNFPSRSVSPVMKEPNDMSSRSLPRFPRSASGNGLSSGTVNGCTSQTRRSRFENVVPCNLVFISTRPHIYKDISERVSYQLFQHMLHEGQLHSLPTLIPGKMLTSFCAVVKAFMRCPSAWRAAGEVKFLAMLEFSQLYPEYSLVFFGDNGQGDLLAAELALEHEPPLISIAFINEVQPRSSSLTKFKDLSPEEMDAKWDSLGVVWMNTPAQAAIHCARKRLISEGALARVCDAAVDDIEALAMRSPHFPRWSERFAELNDALVEARMVKDDIQLLDVQELEDFLDSLRALPTRGASFSTPLLVTDGEF